MAGEKRPFFAGYLDALPVMTSGHDRRPTPARPPESVLVSGRRNSAFYNAHSYHTKVPPEAITPFVEHFTKPGDVVLDPFCGSGMTGVAAALAGRRAILNDLSPAAVHLSWNHTRQCDPEELARGFERLERRVADRLRDLYATRHPDGHRGTIHWTIWSTRHECPACRAQFSLWDAVDRQSGRLGTVVPCPRCHAALTRRSLPSLGSAPAWISYELDNGQRFEKPADAEDTGRATAVKRGSIEEWYPDTPVIADSEMYIRCALHRQGIKTVADFYTPRNLRALAILWHELLKERDERVRRALAFAFTNTAWHGTRMRRFNARGGQRPLTGTLYIPQLSSEANVLEVMRNKIAQLSRYYRSFCPDGCSPVPSITLGSATALLDVPDTSVDYVFTDPPFGSNIFYADCNLIWEAWLGRLTEPGQEAVVNRSLPVARGGKSLATYGELMTAAMREMSRVLKPGGWATVVFHNTDAGVWKEVRDAAARAGFTFHEAASLDRKQQSHKGYKGRAGEEDVAHFDVVMNLRKPPKAEKAASRDAPPITDLVSMVRSVWAQPGMPERGVQGVHAEVMRRLVSLGARDFPEFGEVRAVCGALSGSFGDGQA